jgi:hypothetical protein
MEQKMKCDIPEPIYFDAKWDDKIKILQKKRALIKKGLSYAGYSVLLLTPLRFIYKRIIRFYELALLPSLFSFSKQDIKKITKSFNSFWYTKDKASIKDHYIATPLKIKTPDRVILDATFIKHKKANDNTPTIIIFQPNNSIYKNQKFNWILKDFIKHDKICNLLYFDYRGCGESSGHPKNSKQLFIDGASAYQFVKDQIKTPINKIYFYGFSLGGAVSAHVKHIYNNDGKYINERSFSCTDQIIDVHISAWLTKLTKIGAKRIGWIFNPDKIWKNLQGEKLLIYHPEDPLMQRANLYNSISKKLDTSTTVLKLNIVNDNTIVNNHHNEPIFHYLDENGYLAHDSIINFLIN